MTTLTHDDADAKAAAKAAKREVAKAAKAAAKIAEKAARKAAAVAAGATSPLLVAYGMGVDSTAVLVGLAARGIRPDLILFADTGGEKPETYAYLPVMQAWLASVGFPAIQVVRYAPKHDRYTTLEGNCLANETLPSLAFFGRGCSDKFKREPQDKWVRANFPAARLAWDAGLKCRKMIGYDAGPKDARRSSIAEDDEYTYEYPLREWGWDREECERQIVTAGLPVPVKSACFFCPASKPAEIAALSRDMQDRIVEIERRAAPKMQCGTIVDGLKENGKPATCDQSARAHEHGGACGSFKAKYDGLWGRPTKARPGSMTVYLRVLHAGENIDASAPVDQIGSYGCDGCGEEAAQ